MATYILILIKLVLNGILLIITLPLLLQPFVYLYWYFIYRIWFVSKRALKDYRCWVAIKWFDSELKVLFFSLRYRIIWAFWLLYSIVTFVPNLLVIMCMTSYWIYKFLKLRLIVPHLPNGRSIKLKVWDVEHTPIQHIFNREQCGFQVHWLTTALHDRFDYVGNGRWMIDCNNLVINPDKRNNTSIILWFYYFVYSDLVITNFHKTFRLTILIFHKTLSIDAGTLRTRFTPWVYAYPYWYKSVNVGNCLYSPLPSFSILRKSLYLTDRWCRAPYRRSKDSLLSFKFSSGSVKDYLIALLLSNVNGLAAPSYRLMLIVDASGLFVVRELDLYGGGTDEWLYSTELIPNSSATPEHLLSLKGVLVRHGALLNKADVHPLALKTPLVYKVVSHDGFIGGLERWTLWERVSVLNTTYIKS